MIGDPFARLDLELDAEEILTGLSDLPSAEFWREVEGRLRTLDPDAVELVVDAARSLRSALAHHVNEEAHRG